MYLVDTSAWILHFDKNFAFDLRAICEPEQRVLCLPVYQEILQGIRDETAFRAIRASLQAAIFVENPLTMELYNEAVALYRAARKRGLTLRSSVDCIIAASAIRHDLVVLHHDRDYSSLADVCDLRQQRVGD